MGRSISHSAQCSILSWTPADIFLIIKRWNNSSPLLAFKSHYCQWGSVTGEGAGEVNGRLGMRKARLKTKKSQWHEAVGGEQELIGPNHQWPESLSSGYAPPWSMALQNKCGKKKRLFFFLLQQELWRPSAMQERAEWPCESPHESWIVLKVEI